MGIDHDGFFCYDFRSEDKMPTGSDTFGFFCLEKESIW